MGGVDEVANATEAAVPDQKPDGNPPIDDPEDPLPPLRPVVIVDDGDDFGMTDFEGHEAPWQDVSLHDVPEPEVFEEDDNV